VTIDKVTCVCSIFDTAGQEEYAVMRDTYLRRGEGFLLVYSVTSQTSFDKLGSFIHNIKIVKESTSNEPMVIVGNKCDLEEKRQVDTETGESYAKQNGCPFFETSALTTYNVEKSFFQIVREIRLTHNDKKKPQVVKCILL